MNDIQQNTPWEPIPRDHKLRLRFLGGCGEFGMNATLLSLGSDYVVIDCGVKFADDFMRGADAFIPYWPRIAQAYGDLKAYILTHGHEDHIGAIPHILPQYPAPVYGTAWTIQLIKQKLAYAGYRESQFELNVIQPFCPTEIRGFKKLKKGESPLSIEWVPVNHSIPMACALNIQAAGARLFHTGDFKVDLKAQHEKPIDLSPILYTQTSKNLDTSSKKSWDLLIADSTNAHLPGFAGGEGEVTEAIEKVVAQQKGAVICTTFASNLWRLLAFLNAAEKCKRKVIPIGRGVTSVLETAVETGLLSSKILENLYKKDDFNPKEREKWLYIVSGCQGEPRSSLKRLSLGELKGLSLREGDSLIYSARFIPGNEKQIYNMFDDFLRQGIQIISTKTNPDIHVSGHGQQEDLKWIADQIQPKQMMPIHGSFHHLKAHYDWIQKDLQTEPILFENGSLFVWEDHKFSLEREEQNTTYLIDGDSRWMAPYEKFRERWKIADWGSVFVTCTLRDRDIQEIKINTAGIPFLSTFDEEKILRTKERLEQDIQKSIEGVISTESLSDIANLENEVRIHVRRLFRNKTKKNPVVIVHICFV